MSDVLSDIPADPRAHSTARWAALHRNAGFDHPQPDAEAFDPRVVPGSGRRRVLAFATLICLVLFAFWMAGRW